MRKLAPWIIGFIVGLACGVAFGNGPTDAVASALIDARSLSPQEARSVRYVSCYNVPHDQRAEHGKLLGYVLNTVSRSATIREARACGGGADLVAVDLAALGIPATAWEALVSDGEPYFHITTRVKNPTTGKVEKVYTDGGWIDQWQAAGLRSVTGSGGAVVRLDWFVSRVMSAKHYYSFAGIPKTQKEFYASFALDDETVIKLRANKGANIFRSGVTRKPRRISRWQTPRGALWITYDSEEESDPLKNPFRVPGFVFDYDANEDIFVRANGLHGFALWNRKGERQDTVPDKIAKDDSDPHGDGILTAPISCIRCHTESGIRPFSNDMAKLLERGADLHLGAKDLDELAAFYDNARLEVQAKRDREDYEAAVERATRGLTGKEVAEKLAALFGAYEYEQVNAEKAAAELGVDSLDALKASNDPILIALVTGFSVNRRDWELSYPEAAVLSAGAGR